MLERWITVRCFREDVSSVADTAGVVKHLRDKGASSSGTEALASASRAGVFTFHHAKGRGARWVDEQRNLLWLVAFSTSHDQGYDLAEQLDEQGRLYPSLDPNWTDQAGSTAVWGEYPDEDCLEWAQQIHGVLEAAEATRTASAGPRTEFTGTVVVWVDDEGDGLWTMTIGRRLRYEQNGSPRERWLTPAELRALVDHLVVTAAEDDVEWDNPPDPQNFLFARVCFLGALRSPEQWHDYLLHKASAGAVPLLTPN